MRKPVQRRSVDYTSTAVRFLELRMLEKDIRDPEALQITPAATINLLPSSAYLNNPISSFCTKFVHQSTNKVRCSINRVLWTPNGRRLMTGSESGEFTLWNGQSFNFEMILQAHDVAIRSMVWSHNENLMVTGDHVGCIKYWQSNMNNVKANKAAHKEPVRDLGFSCTDLKFCSCSDDKTVKVWDFARCQEELSLTGHRGDVHTVDWHPQKAMLASGSKDYLVKLWDAKSGKELCTLHGHKNAVLSVKWNQNGNWLLTASRDNLIKLYDIRTLKEIETFKGHKKEVTALAWHPFHEEYFVSGGYDGMIIHWLANHEQVMAEVNAHENCVWDLSWHPMGHILCSGSNDKSTKFWCRNRPGESIRDRMVTSQSQLSGDYYSGGPMYPTYPGGGSELEPDALAGGSIPGLGTPPAVPPHHGYPTVPGHGPRIPVPSHGSVPRPYPNQAMAAVAPGYPPMPYRSIPPPYAPPMHTDFRAPMMQGGQGMMRPGGQAIPPGGYGSGSSGALGRPPVYSGPQMGMGGSGYGASGDPRLQSGNPVDPRLSQTMTGTPQINDPSAQKSVKPGL